MAKDWWWSAPVWIERNAGAIRLKGWRSYPAEHVPALWLRVAALTSGLADADGWLKALKEYGPLDPVVDERPRPEEYLRDPWERTIKRLDEVALLWREGESGVWELPDAPIELTQGYRRLQDEFGRVLRDGVRLTARGLEPALDPLTLDGFLWLAAAESIRFRHRFKHCERCDGWFGVQRTDARFCSTACRRSPEPASDEAAAAGK
jgi:hypothetical protein